MPCVQYAQCIDASKYRKNKNVKSVTFYYRASYRDLMIAVNLDFSACFRNSLRLKCSSIRKTSNIMNAIFLHNTYKSYILNVLYFILQSYLYVSCVHIQPRNNFAHNRAH